ncbi:hypothetical protein BAE44_0012055 [Dichanthelium oligosanthes]|uniref:Calmodulin binding protein-like N-terminal domain-containing protein n=1 Tax=Dichanthelium oligosanthes TaxID=888268 RepID=A0A1E5VPA4_9POAL|nr:hypothetical protein BAE44_0012055 [Dichanthelium oligosanthes]
MLVRGLKRMGGGGGGDLCYRAGKKGKGSIVALDVDFNASNREGWTLEEFESLIVRPRDRVGVVLTGKLELQLKNDVACFENINFDDNSKFKRSGKFRLGVKLTDNLAERVQEGITEPFAVRDRCGEDQIIHEVDEQDTSQGNDFSGVYSQQCTLQRLHSRRMRALPSAQENNENVASFDIDGRLDYDYEIQFETPNSNCITDSPVFSRQHSFSESDLHELMRTLEKDISHFSAANLSELPADVQCFMVKLLSCRRWIKLNAPGKWVAIMASSKKIRASKGKAHV